MNKGTINKEDILRLVCEMRKNETWSSVSLQVYRNRNDPKNPYDSWRCDFGSAFAFGHGFAEAKSAEVCIVLAAINAIVNSINTEKIDGQI